jgi:hypothetical protein
MVMFFEYGVVASNSFPQQDYTHLSVCDKTLQVPIDCATTDLWERFANTPVDLLCIRVRMIVTQRRIHSG